MQSIPEPSNEIVQPLGSAGSGCLAFRLDLAWLSPVSRGPHCPIWQVNNFRSLLRLDPHPFSSVGANRLEASVQAPWTLWVFTRSKGLKDLIADSAFKRMQVDVQGACRLDADEHHRGLAPRTDRAPNCSEWNDGRDVLRLGHEGFP